MTGCRPAAHFLVLLTTLGPIILRAEESTPPPAGPPVLTVPLRSIAAPVPSLQHRLTADPARLRRGNAALPLYRACLLRAEQLGRERAAAGRSQPTGDFTQLRAWLDLPARDFPRDQVRQFLAEQTSVRHEIEVALACDHADWQFDRPDNGVAFLMPEIQETRVLAMILALEARLAALDGRTGDALAAIRAQGTLARLVATGPNMIQALVGVQITDQMAASLHDLASLPDAPSLFWALAERPRPFINQRAALESERLMLEIEVPDLRELDHGIWTAERVHRCVETLSRLLVQNSNDPFDPSLNSVNAALDAARIYPEARRRLIAEGQPAAEVDARPVLQVALGATYRTYLHHRDELFRWANVPIWEASARIDQAMAKHRKQGASSLLTEMLEFSVDSPLGACRWAGAWSERRLDAWQVVEAIRLDASRHEGRLPASLDAITDLPLPRDPATGQPFGYRVEGDSAVVVAPLPPAFGGTSPTAPFTFEIRLTPSAPALAR